MSGKSFEVKVALKAPPAKVYEALTTERGVSGWWTPDCELGDKVGDKAVFRFGKMVDVMRIDALDPDREVRWHVLEQHNHLSDLMADNTEWVGTDIIFALTANAGGGTDLHFRHEGLTPNLACYQICNDGWNHFIKTSLPGLLDQGTGRPYQAKAAAEAS
ncbi:MAG: SRPBCC domain-containing protein [Pseudomonadota bacterium]